MTLLVATTNPGKIREIRLVLAGLPVEILTLADLPGGASGPEPEETGATFADNAALKAQEYAARSGLPTVAEDSGLMVDALGGRPGVESARYPGATYPEKFVRLYAELAPHPRPWTARFVCAVAFRQADGQASITFSTLATVEGEIARAPQGTHGFGYDPIFFFPPYGCTLGEATDAQKLAVSHRGRAFRRFREWAASHLDAFAPGR